MMRAGLYFLFALAAWNAGYAQKAPAWSELCQGYGSGRPLFIVDGIPVDADNVVSPTTVTGEMIIRNGKDSLTIKLEDIENVSVLKTPVGSIGHNPDKCVILISTKKPRKRFEAKKAKTDSIKIKYLACRSTIPESGLLYVIDHKLVYTDSVPDPLKNIDWASITSITVLKGPSAAALFGASGIHGVVVVTTKRAMQAKKRRRKKS